jgi:hypothetical protein
MYVPTGGQNITRKGQIPQTTKHINLTFSKSNLNNASKKQFSSQNTQNLKGISQLSKGVN